MREGKGKKERGRGGEEEGRHIRTTRRWLLTLFQITRTCKKRKDIFCNKTQEMVCVLSLQPGLTPNSH